MGKEIWALVAHYKDSSSPFSSGSGERRYWFRGVFLSSVQKDDNSTLRVMLGRELPFAYAFPSLGVGNRGCCPSTTTEVMPAVPTLQNLYSATSQSGFVNRRFDSRGYEGMLFKFGVKAKVFGA